MPLPEPPLAAGTPGARPSLDLPLFYAAYATPIEEPWDAVIHQALQRAAAGGKIRYEYADDIGYSGDMERVLREVAGKQAPTAIFGDAYGNEQAVRRVAGEYPAVPFVFGSGLGPSGPNLSVFDERAVGPDQPGPVPRRDQRVAAGKLHGDPMILERRHRTCDAHIS